MFRQPTQAEIDYLWPYIQNKESALKGDINWVKGGATIAYYMLIGLTIICILGLAIPGAIFFGVCAWLCGAGIKQLRNNLNDYNQTLNSQNNSISFMIADCVLTEIVQGENAHFYEQYNPAYINENVGMRGQYDTYCKVIMSNGDNVCCRYVSTAFAEQKGITWMQKINGITTYTYQLVHYNQPAYLIQTSIGMQDFVIVNPNY